MDTVTIIVLTALINFTITGLGGALILYRIQKRIDAAIQRSFFEYQTKFARNYPKILEVLETFRQKLYQCYRLIEEYVVLIQPVYISPGGSLPLPEQFTLDKAELSKRQEKLNHLQGQFEEASLACGVYLRENRMYLSDALLSVLEDVHSKNRKLAKTLTVCMNNLDVPIKRLLLDRELYRSESLDMFSIFGGQFKAAFVIRIILNDYGELIERLDGVYKSIAGAN